MAQKKYDAVIAVDEYTDNQGQQKTRWQNVGAVLQTEKGFVLLLDRTFNPAGVKNPDGRSNVMVNLFEPNQNQQQSSAGQYRQQTQGGQPPADDGSIPF